MWDLDIECMDSIAAGVLFSEASEELWSESVDLLAS